MIRSKTTGKTYDPDLMIYIVNPKQNAFYLTQGITLYDVFESRGSLLCAWNKTESYPAYDLWCKQKPKYE